MKPAKPRPDFPLFPHATGRWAKKINGRFAFFGPWEDPTAALEMYLAQRDALYAGRLPRRMSAAAASGRGTSSGTGSGAKTESSAGGAQVRDLVNHFLTAKQRRVAGGEMGLRSFSEYHKACGRLVKQFGAGRVIDDLDADDFGRLRASLATTRGPVTLGNEIGRIRSVFKYAYEAGLVDKPMRFGPDFMKPAKRTVRLARQARGPRMFEPAEIKALLAAARVQMRAMILLGLNCGMGNTDVATLTWGGLDLKKGFVELPRPKTGIARRAVLWPETIKALELVRKARSERDGKKTPLGRGDRVFMTKQGNPWVRVDEPGERSKGKNRAVVKDSVAMEFGKVATAAGLTRDGRGFYALRHTFRTVADEVGDRRAIDLVMGHEDGADIATQYVERIDDRRLAKVAAHVRTWVGIGAKSRT